MEKLAKWLSPSLQDIITAIVFIVIIIALPQVKDFDIWWHLKTGEIITQTKTIPQIDTYSYTNYGKPWVDHEWLSQVFLYKAYQYFNINGLVLWNALMPAITLALLFSLLMLEGFNPLLNAFLCVLAFVGTAGIWSCRPHLLTTFFFVLLFYLLTKYRKTNKNFYIYLIPFIMLAWVNWHSGFIIGFVVLLTYLVGNFLEHKINPLKNNILNKHQLKKLMMVTALSCIIIFLNPYTYKAVFHPFLYMSGKLPNKDFISEWASPNFRNATEFVLYTLFFTGILALSKKRISITNLFFFLGFLFLSLDARRNIAVYVLGTTPILAIHLNEVLISLSSKISKLKKINTASKINNYFISRSKMFYENEIILNKHIFLIAFITTISYMVLSGRYDKFFNIGIDKKNFPIKAVEYIKENHISGNMFNLYHWGGYLIYNLYPNEKVFVDGRNEIHGFDMLKKYYRLLFAKEHWEKVVNEYNINYFLTDKNAAIRQVLLSTNDWKEIYSDDNSSLIIKTK